MPWAFFTPTPSHNNNSVMCTFYHFIIPHLLHSGLVLSCCVLGGVLKAVFRVSLSVHAEMKEHQVSSPALEDVQPTRLRPNPPNLPSACWASSCVDGESGGSGVMWDTFAFFSNAGQPCALNFPPWFPAFVLQVLSVPQTRLSFHPLGRTLGGILLWSFPSLGSDYLSKSFVKSKHHHYKTSLAGLEFKARIPKGQCKVYF